jgi:hypothetical protein
MKVQWQKRGTALIFVIGNLSAGLEDFQSPEAKQNDPIPNPKFRRQDEGLQPP